MNSHSVKKAQTELNPRKMPVQTRSTKTVDTIFQATIQVLTKVGMSRLTTTRVAERAGVSVGTLYQYFPNKSALLAFTLKQHLTSIVEQIEKACQDNHGRSTDVIAEQLVSAFVAAKMNDQTTSKALYAVVAQVEGASIVAQLSQRAQIAVCTVLSSAKGRHFEDLPTVAFICSGALIGPVQSLLELEASQSMVTKTRAQLILMTKSYLRSTSTRK